MAWLPHRPHAPPSPPPVQSGHVLSLPPYRSSMSRPFPRTNWTRQIWARAFSAESVAAALGVPAAALPDLAALLGNDITTEAVQVLPRLAVVNRGSVQ